MLFEIKADVATIRSVAMEVKQYLNKKTNFKTVFAKFPGNHNYFFLTKFKQCM